MRRYWGASRVRRSVKEGLRKVAGYIGFLSFISGLVYLGKVVGSMGA